MRKYACPYCGEKFVKDKLVDHIEDEHDDELPVNYTAYRAAYDAINHKPGHGSCVCCGKDTKWNEKTQKYNRLCGDPKCTKKIRETYRSRMMKVYGKVHLLDDPHQQEKMLTHRKIAGKYKWSDGKIFDYVGSYEKEFLEFLDKVMNYDSSDIVAPGPILEYEINGKKRHWITDFLILSANLVVEIKDGSSNPNKRSMPEYRAKQVAKEKMITNMGVYSYLRLTNKEFGQLLAILAEIKMNIIDDNNHPIYRIHEECDFLENEMNIHVNNYKFFIPEAVDILHQLSRTIFHPWNEDIVSITETGIIKINPMDDTLIYEIATIKPNIIQSSVQKIFKKYTTSLLDHFSVQANNIQIFNIDPNDINKGIGVGVIV